MPWMLIYVAISVVGVAVLGWCAVRVCVAVRHLGQEVQRAEEQIEPRLAVLREAVDRGHRS